MVVAVLTEFVCSFTNHIILLIIIGIGSAFKTVALLIENTFKAGYLSTDWIDVQIKYERFHRLVWMSA